jgi:hypothetical protein
MSRAELVAVFRHLRIPCCVLRGSPGVIGRNVSDDVFSWEKGDRRMYSETARRPSASCGPMRTSLWRLKRAHEVYAGVATGVGGAVSGS